MRRIFRSAIVTALAMWLVPSAAFSQTLNAPAKSSNVVATPLEAAIIRRIDQLEQNTNADRQRREQIADWYQQRNFEPVWLSGSKPSKQAQEMVYAMMMAYEDGLVPSEYNAINLFNKLDSLSPEAVADFEISMSRATVLYGQHLYSGRVEPREVNRKNVLYPDDISAPRILNKVARAENAKIAVTTLSPSTPRYARLKNHLTELFLIRANGGWVQIPDGEVLKPGMTDPRIDLIRKRLIQSGDLPRGAHTSEDFDGYLLQAFKYYQWRMGLATDGVLGPASLEQLNTTVEQRIRQVELNLERRRWMQADFGSSHIFVNLADQVLRVVHNEKTVHTAVVQVGLPFHSTPVFTEEMEYLDFNPYWNVPYSIATKEYLPKLKQNPYALSAQNIRVLRSEKVVDPASVPWASYSTANFPVRLRQDPGPSNALGRVKFMFPNKYNIYIHDTPSKSRFSSFSRYFSHGCIRVNNPFKLAKIILGMQGITPGAVDRITGSSKRKVVKLEQNLPVHVAYLTAWVEKDGTIHYRRDVYGRDTKLAAALAQIN